jgi:hypothetical protein
MRLHSYRDEGHARHFDLIGGGGHPWSIDLVSVTAHGIPHHRSVGQVTRAVAILLRPSTGGPRRGAQLQP